MRVSTRCECDTLRTRAFWCMWLTYDVKVRDYLSRLSYAHKYILIWNIFLGCLLSFLLSPSPSPSRTAFPLASLSCSCSNLYLDALEPSDAQSYLLFREMGDAFPSEIYGCALHRALHRTKPLRAWESRWKDFRHKLTSWQKQRRISLSRDQRLECLRRFKRRH